MAAGARAWGSCLILSCAVFLCLLPPSLRGGEPSKTSTTLSCDEGKIGGDIENLKLWTSCQGDLFKITQFLQPSYQEECVPTLEESTAQCMNTPLDYVDHPPSRGDYRPMRPKYGTYHYLPPQRWLSALQYGAVVFLYHPCTPPEQVAQLKQLAQNCLWRHYISPYPHLNSNWPMAVVSWGCVLRVRWVETDRVKEWVSSHALHTPLAAEVPTDGVYDEGLIHGAERVVVDGREVLCPSHPPPSAAPTPTTNTSKNQDKPTICTNSTQSTQTNERGTSCSLPPTPTCCVDPPTTHTDTSLHHHIGYSILILLACVTLMCVVLVFTWNLCCAKHSRKQRAKYKSVSKFFPFSYGQQLDDGSGEGVNVAIPEYGLPKSGRAETEMLLNESDEDEI